MKDLKVGDEKWVIACKEKEDGFTFAPLLVKIEEIKEDENAISLDKYAITDCVVSLVVTEKRAVTTFTIKSIKDKFFENEKSCLAAIQESVRRVTNRIKSDCPCDRPLDFVLI